MNDKFEKTLRDAGLSVTKPREIVFSALRAGNPRTMRELTDDLSNSIDRASIYRTIETFEKIGIVHRIQTGWKYKLELSDDFLPHHHHITCLRCGLMISFDEPAELESLISDVTTKYAFVAKEHSLEISGLCAKCQQA